MPPVIIHGFPASTYVRTARLACAEKGVPHALRPLDFGSDSHAALHPWRKMPALTHGDVAIFETSAICRYIDEAFEGPALVPADPVGRAQVEQWISAFGAYIYPPMVHDLYFPLRRAAKSGEPADEAAIAKALERVQRGLQAVEARVAGSPWMVGEQLSSADLLFAPVLALARAMPLTAPMFDAMPKLSAVVDAMQARPSWAETTD